MNELELNIISKSKIKLKNDLPRLDKPTWTGMGQFDASVSAMDVSAINVSAMDVSAMECEMCFPLECHQSAKFTLLSSGKRVSARVILALVPDLSIYAVFIAIHDGYYGFGSAITDYS